MVQETSKLNLDGDPNHYADCPIRNLTIAQQIMGGL